MARRTEDASRQAKGAKKRTRHPLLVNHNLGRRYRPPGILLILLGTILLLPSVISDLQNELVAPEILGVLGVALVLVGLALWLFSILAKRRSYVQCLPDVLIVRTPFYRATMSYRRVKQAQPVLVSQIFPRETLKGMGKPLVKPLLGMTAVELQVKSWPVPKRRLQRIMGRYLFSTRTEGWLFIVPDYSLLLRQLDAAMSQKTETTRQTASGYQDPFERLRRGG